MRESSATGGDRSKRSRLAKAGKRGRDPLLAAICHDLRAPLAAVTMGANFVLQTTQRDEQNARSVKILEAMLRSCTQMERLIRNFADLSEIDGNAVSFGSACTTPVRCSSSRPRPHERPRARDR